MTAGLHTTNVANGWLNAIRAGGATFTVVAGTFVKLHIGDPGGAGTSNPSVGSTTRVAVTQAAASGGSIAENGTAPVWTNGGASESLSYISVWSDVSAGVFLYSVQLTAPKAWDSTDTFTLDTLTVSLTPLAA